ncbi:hypothetical protein HK102_002348, partial [Quaeritorhiza haematococci]
TVVILCISEEYTASALRTFHATYANETLKLPIIPVLVGEKKPWHRVLRAAAQAVGWSMSSMQGGFGQGRYTHTRGEAGDEDENGGVGFELKGDGMPMLDFTEPKLFRRRMVQLLNAIEGVVVNLESGGSVPRGVSGSVKSITNGVEQEQVQHQKTDDAGEAVKKNVDDEEEILDLKKDVRDALRGDIVECLEVIGYDFPLPGEGKNNNHQGPTEKMKMRAGFVWVPKVITYTITQDANQYPHCLRPSWNTWRLTSFGWAGDDFYENSLIGPDGIRNIRTPSPPSSCTTLRPGSNIEVRLVGKAKLTWFSPDDEGRNDPNYIWWPGTIVKILDGEGSEVTREDREGRVDVDVDVDASKWMFEVELWVISGSEPARCTVPCGQIRAVQDPRPRRFAAQQQFYVDRVGTGSEPQADSLPSSTTNPANEANNGTTPGSNPQTDGGNCAKLLSGGGVIRQKNDYFLTSACASESLSHMHPDKKARLRVKGSLREQTLARRKFILENAFSFISQEQREILLTNNTRDLQSLVSPSPSIEPWERYKMFPASETATNVVARKVSVKTAEALLADVEEAGRRLEREMRGESIWDETGSSLDGEILLRLGTGDISDSLSTSVTGFALKEKEEGDEDVVEPENDPKMKQLLQAVNRPGELYRIEFNTWRARSVLSMFPFSNSLSDQQKPSFSPSTSTTPPRPPQHILPFPMSPSLEDLPFAYYEVTVESLAIDPTIAAISVGVAMMNLNANAGAIGHLMVGWVHGSAGFHSLHGRLLHSSASRAIPFHATPYGPGDTVGVGFEYSARRVFFTLNGKFLGVGFGSVVVSDSPSETSPQRAGVAAEEQSARKRVVTVGPTLPGRREYCAAVSADGPCRVIVNFGPVISEQEEGESEANAQRERVRTVRGKPFIWDPIANMHQIPPAPAAPASATTNAELKGRQKQKQKRNREDKKGGGNKEKADRAMEAGTDIALAAESALQDFHGLAALEQAVFEEEPDQSIRAPPPSNDSDSFPDVLPFNIFEGDEHDHATSSSVASFTPGTTDGNSVSCRAKGGLEYVPPRMDSLSESADGHTLVAVAAEQNKTAAAKDVPTGGCMCG